MRRSVLFACIILALTVVPAFSANIGPVKSNLSAGDAFYGLGYSNTDSKWEDNGVYSNLEIQQNRFYGQFGYTLTDAWVGYVRAGIATHDASDAFIPGADFEGTDPLPFVTVGANGLFFNNRVLSIGGFVQGSYFVGETEDSVKYLDILVSATGAETVKETVTFDKMWEAKAGIQFQMELEGAQLYGGPMYYISEADIENRFVGALTGPYAIWSKTVEEEDNFGFVAGVQWKLLENVTLDLEAQLRSAYDIGFVLNKRF
ncbi:MAG: hypothetical protein RQ754_14665 [Desulfuromonadales bacterium]|nr:hypothetical protein [Desulfuromonadales bacterium]